MFEVRVVGPKRETLNAYRCRQVSYCVALAEVLERFNRKIRTWKSLIIRGPFWGDAYNKD